MMKLFYFMYIYTITFEPKRKLWANCVLNALHLPNSLFYVDINLDYLDLEQWHFNIVIIILFQTECAAA